MYIRVRCTEALRAGNSVNTGYKSCSLLVSRFIPPRTAVPSALPYRPHVLGVFARVRLFPCLAKAARRSFHPDAEPQTYHVASALFPYANTTPARLDTRSVQLCNRQVLSITGSQIFDFCFSRSFFFFTYADCCWPRNKWCFYLFIFF